MLVIMTRKARWRMVMCVCVWWGGWREVMVMNGGSEEMPRR